MKDVSGILFFDLVYRIFNDGTLRVYLAYILYLWYVVMIFNRSLLVLKEKLKLNKN